MKLHRATRIAALLITLFAAGKAGETSQTTEHVDVILQNPCNLEDVYVWGKVHYLLSMTLTSSGQRHYVISANGMGLKGYGLDTGTWYRRNGSQFLVENGSDETGQFTGTFVDSYRLISQGGAPDAHIQDIGYITVTPDGELRVYGIQRRVSGCLKPTV